MGYTRHQLEQAAIRQLAAAKDPSPQVRLIAGPGAGKSKSINGRVRWLITEQHIPAESIHIISFTRASTEDLRGSIQKECADLANAEELRISTLHSLALRLLVRAGQLAQYPVKPRILNDAEQTDIFDLEFSTKYRTSAKRRNEIRLHFEAMWSTRNPPPAFLSQPDPPISTAEQGVFRSYHNQRSQVYACLLPGEAVRKCVDSIATGLIDPIELLGIKHLIVDEYQDLNPVDVEFIDLLARKGVVVFVCGDDDQSIYSFRYAFPDGIQTFTTRHIGTGTHTLETCFRCSTSVFDAAQGLIQANASPRRIEKVFHSAYSASSPPVTGFVHRWRFNTHRAEARAIAASCTALISAGLDPGKILVLFSGRGDLSRIVEEELTGASLPFSSCSSELLSGSPIGRAIAAILRLAKNSDDYVAYRVLLGIKKGIGIGTCSAIADKVIERSLDYKAIFTQPIPPNVFQGRELRAIDSVRIVVAALANWNFEDDLGARRAEILTLLKEPLGLDVSAWEQVLDMLPAEMKMEELDRLLSASSEDDERRVIEEMSVRLDIEPDVSLASPNRIRCLTLHTSKGLSSEVVFIPGLEEEQLPGPKRARYAGQIQESARLLYVGITRARAACIVSFADRRAVFATMQSRQPSRFCTNLDGPFISRTQGLSNAETAELMTHVGLL